MEWAIRRAGTEDAEAWARCQRECWRETYGPLVDAERLVAALGAEETWVRRVREQLQSPGPVRWVGTDEAGMVVGVAVAGPARGELARESPEQLYALYVRQEWHGTGLGQALLDHVLGGVAACLEVLEDNQRARAFYARNGFRPTGIRQWFERLEAWEVVLSRPEQSRRAPTTSRADQAVR